MSFKPADQNIPQAWKVDITGSDQDDFSWFVGKKMASNCVEGKLMNASAAAFGNSIMYHKKQENTRSSKILNNP